MQLKDLTTFGIGGQIKDYIRVDHRDALLATLESVDPENILIIGGGSNILPQDGEYAKTVIHICASYNSDALYNASAWVWSGCKLDDVSIALRAASLAGIPGSLGGAVVQNAGAYGEEISDYVLEVEVYDFEQRCVKVIQHGLCGFKYRDSMFKRNPRYVVLGVRFRDESTVLHGSKVRETEYSRDEILDMRAHKGMLEPGFPRGDANDVDRHSAGSFFTNPLVCHEHYLGIAQDFSTERVPHWNVNEGVEKLSAAWLIEHAGFKKGFQLSGHRTARLSSKHTLAIVNSAQSERSGQEVRALASHIAAGVKKTFGVELVPEPIEL